MKTEWLASLSINDRYERKARLLPALLALTPLVPAALAFGLPALGWLQILATSVGLSAIAGVGLSHMASAFGNRIQKQLWPDWPHDSPTHRWLQPDDKSTSRQQKDRWYAAIRDTANMDIAIAAAAGAEELKAAINDSLRTVRNRLWKGGACSRLQIHNTDYGFARNLAGLRSLWISFAALSAGGCWFGYFFYETHLAWALVASGILPIALLLAFEILPQYVRSKAKHYADSLFSALLDETNDAETKKSVAMKTSDEDNDSTPNWPERIRAAECSKAIELDRNGRSTSPAQVELVSPRER